MEVKYTEQKLKLFENILTINDKELLGKMQFLITNFKSNIKNKTVQKQKIEEKSISFEEWNKQFTDDRSLDEYISEYDMTLREFRKNIYEAEVGEGMTLQEFKKSIRTW